MRARLHPRSMDNHSTPPPSDSCLGDSPSTSPLAPNYPLRIITDCDRPPMPSPPHLKTGIDINTIPPPSPTDTEIVSHPSPYPVDILYEEGLVDPYLESRPWNAMKALVQHDHTLRNPTLYRRTAVSELLMRGRNVTEEEVLEEGWRDHLVDPRFRFVDAGNAMDLWRLCFIGWLDKDEMVSRGLWNAVTVREVEMYGTRFMERRSQGEEAVWRDQEGKEGMVVVGPECPTPTERVQMRRVVFDYKPADTQATWPEACHDEVSDKFFFGQEFDEGDSLTVDKIAEERAKLGIKTGRQPLGRQRPFRGYVG